MRIIIAGGGTGGHVIPGLAIARELREHHSAECLFIGTARGLETRLVPAGDCPLELIRVGQLKNVSLLTRLKTLTDLPRSVLHCVNFFRRWRPNALVSVGGYASGPGALAALLLRIPVVAFEPNYVAGFANRRIAPFVAAAGVQFPHTAKLFRNGEVTGVPIRREFFSIPPISPNDPPTLLIFGGSQGARALNQAVTAALPALAESLPQLRIVHQTGPKDLAEVRAAYAATPQVNAEALEFLDDMPARMAQSQVILCRSGASTVAEIAAAGRAAIFVPLPTAADDHQTKNAQAMADANAAILLPQNQLTPASLTETLHSLFTNPERIHSLATAARELARPNAATRLAELVVNAAQKH